MMANMMGSWGVWVKDGVISTKKTFVRSSHLLPIITPITNPGVVWESRKRACRDFRESGMEATNTILKVSSIKGHKLRFRLVCK